MEQKKILTSMSEPFSASFFPYVIVYNLFTVRNYNAVLASVSYETHPMQK